MPRRKLQWEFWPLPKQIAKDTKLSLTEKVVLASLFGRENGEANPARVKQKTLAEEWGLSLRGVSGAIAKLEKLGYIEKNRMGKTLCNRYGVKRI